MEKDFYIATAIAYAYAKPHIGNMYDFILADSIARYKREKGYNVYFQTGTDEFGQKIGNYAVSNNMDPQDLVDETSSIVRNLCDGMNVSYDRFVRTTDPIHVKKVQEIFTKLYNKGDIYKGTYNGSYCVPCESFFAKSAIKDDLCPDCGRKLIDSSEEAYFLKLSTYEDKLKEYLSDNIVIPEFRKQEIINNFIADGLQDLCVSRTTVEWGIEVPFDTKHRIYVWLDALTNYINFFEDDIKQCDLHIIGKDILRFHIIYYPVILMALGLELPKKFLAHSWVLAKDGKMSKSLGNVLYSDDLAEKYGVDPIRYYILHELNYSNDGRFYDEIFIERYNSDLANTIGNLVNRTISMANKYFDGNIINTKEVQGVDNSFQTEIDSLIEEYFVNMDNYIVYEALENVLKIYKRCNKYIDETTPWVLGKENNNDRLHTVLYNLLNNIRVATILLKPFMPETAENIFKQINTSDIMFDTIKRESEFNNLEKPTPIFNRIEIM